MLDTLSFWRHIDLINPYPSSRELCKRAGVSYGNICKQRTNLYMPKPEALLKLSKALGVSIECLLTGEEDRRYPPEIEEIARWLKLFGTSEDIAIIRRLLRIPAKNNTVSNKKLG